MKSLTKIMLIKPCDLVMNPFAHNVSLGDLSVPGYKYRCVIVLAQDQRPCPDRCRRSFFAMSAKAIGLKSLYALCEPWLHPAARLPGRSKQMHAMIENATMIVALETLRMDIEGPLEPTDSEIGDIYDDYYKNHHVYSDGDS